MSCQISITMISGGTSYACTSTDRTVSDVMVGAKSNEPSASSIYREASKVAIPSIAK